MSTFQPQLLAVNSTVVPAGDQTPHICPQCKQSSVYSSKSTKQVVVMFVAVTTDAKELWVCTTEECGWKAPLSDKPSEWEPEKEDKLVDL
ncbi:hypothetical protein C8F01DRAFT_77811 [Mycena amicta]|nr:hypothetical protein C8F01DRAFT_77811 [Mycena amicta]